MKKLMLPVLGAKKGDGAISQQPGVDRPGRKKNHASIDSFRKALFQTL